MSRRFEALYRVEGPNFVGGLGIGVDGLVNWGAPILGYMIGWDRERVLDYCRDKRWNVEQIGGYPT